jgi:hypothetical protein
MGRRGWRLRLSRAPLRQWHATALAGLIPIGALRLTLHASLCERTSARMVGLLCSLRDVAVPLCHALAAGVTAASPAVQSRGFALPPFFPDCERAG